ncbi:CIH_collapsed_G0006400.mRNA.1.CDS.1 [Saccharomyces cerevisiae]|nr:CIH_collapsed_G0006400.mRNA.1.CDS.1 [Saccharomyces cerevisiae]
MGIFAFSPSDDLHENANELSSFTSQGGNFEIEQEDAHTPERKHMSQINKTVSSDIPDALLARSSAQKVDRQQHASKTSG